MARPPSVLQQFLSPMGSPRPRSTAGGSALSLGSLPRALASADKSAGRKKDRKTKKTSSKGKSKTGGTGGKTMGSMGKSGGVEFWRQLTNLRKSKPLESTTPRASAMTSKSLLGLGITSRGGMSSRDVGITERVTGDGSLARSCRKLGDKSDWNFKKSTIISPSGQNLRSSALKERPNNSDLTHKIREVMKRNAMISTSRIRNKVNSEVSAISLVGLDEQFKYHQAKMLTKNKALLLGMKVDKLIKAVQESNSKAQSKTITDYLGFDKFAKKSSPNTPAHTSRRFFTSKKEVTHSFADYSLCQPTNFKLLLLVPQTPLPFCKRLGTKKGSATTQIFLSRDTIHFPEVRVFGRHPDQPDSKPIFNLLLNMMPAREKIRPQGQRDFNMKVQPADVNRREDNKSLLFDSSDHVLDLGAIQKDPRLTKSKIKPRSSIYCDTALDMPADSFLHGGQNYRLFNPYLDYTPMRESEEGGTSSLAKKIPSGTPKAHPKLGLLRTDCRAQEERASSMKRLQLKTRADYQETRPSGHQMSARETTRLPDRDPLSETTLRKLLAAKKSMYKASAANSKSNGQILIQINHEDEPKPEKKEDGAETPKFVSPTGSTSKPLNLLASLKQLKSSLPRNKAN